MKFDINNYKGKFAMHCKTEEEARDFCNYLHSIGRKWSGRSLYKNNTMYSIYENNTAYAFNCGEYCSTTWYKEHGYTILEWEDFMNKEFTKADLRTGDVILQRNGLVGIVNCDLEMIICRNGGWNDLDMVREDLTNESGDIFDIVEVRRPTKKSECCFDAITHKWGTLVYGEVEEMTLAEVCKLLGKNIKIVQ